MNDNDFDPELIGLIEQRIRKARVLLTRQRLSVSRTVGDLHHAIRDGLTQGMSPTRLAKLSGLHVSRIYQIHRRDDAELTC